jgi:hypothetical protein
MDVKCLIVPGFLIAMVLITVVSSAAGRLAQQRETARQVWLNDSMKGSKMVVPAAVWEPGQPVIEEHVPVPDENSTENYLHEMAERRERQNARAKMMAIKRAHERSAQEAAHRSDVDAIIKRAYASLGKELE